MPSTSGAKRLRKNLGSQNIIKGKICRSPYFQRARKVKSRTKKESSNQESYSKRNKYAIAKTRETIPPGSRGIHSLTNYVPPRSPYNLLQETVFNDPWKLLVGTIFLNKTSGTLAIPVFWEFVKRWPTPQDVIKGDQKEMAELIHPLGLYRKRAEIIKRFSHDYLNKDWLLPVDLYGIGKYGNDSYRIFCVGDWQNVTPNDHKLSDYHTWLVTQSNTQS